MLVPEIFFQYFAAQGRPCLDQDLVDPLFAEKVDCRFKVHVCNDLKASFFSLLQPVLRHPLSSVQNDQPSLFSNNRYPRRAPAFSMIICITLDNKVLSTISPEIVWAAFITVVRSRLLLDCLSIMVVFEVWVLAVTSTNNSVYFSSKSLTMITAPHCLKRP